MTTGELQLPNLTQELSVRLGDGQFARIGSIVGMAIPPGPLIDVASGIVMRWAITGIIVNGPFDVLVSGGPVNNTLSATLNSVTHLNLLTF